MILRFNQLNESSENDIRTVKDMFMDLDDDLNFIKEISPIEFDIDNGLTQTIHFNEFLQQQYTDLKSYKISLDRLQKIYEVLDRMSKFMDYTFHLIGETIIFYYPYNDNIKTLLGKLEVKNDTKGNYIINLDDYAIRGEEESSDENDGEYKGLSRMQKNRLMRKKAKEKKLKSRGRPSRNFINMDFSGHRIPRDTFEVNDDFSCSMVITSGNGMKKLKKL